MRSVRGSTAGSLVWTTKKEDSPAKNKGLKSHWVEYRAKWENHPWNLAGKFLVFETALNHLQTPGLSIVMIVFTGPNPAANLRCPPDINSGNFAIKVTRKYASPGIVTGYSTGGNNPLIHGRTHESGIYMDLPSPRLLKQLRSMAVPQTSADVSQLIVVITYYYHS
jgi:hypothetical protein